MAHPLVAPIAHILFSLQQAVAATAKPATTTQPAKPADDVEALGPMSPAWRQTRALLGHQGKWPTLEQIHAALEAQVAGGVPVTFAAAPNAAVNSCVVCGSTSKDENGVCTQCEYGTDDFIG